MFTLKKIKCVIHTKLGVRLLSLYAHSKKCVLHTFEIVCKTHLYCSVYALVCHTHFFYRNKYSNQKHCIYKIRKYD